MSSTDILINLSERIALLLAMTFAFELLRPCLNRIRPVYRNVLGGLIFGLFGIIDILTSVEVAPGFILDGRTIMIAVAGAYSGGMTAFIAAVMVSIFRIIIGGAGVWSAVAAALTAACLGYLLYQYHQRRHTVLHAGSLLVLGTAVGVQRLIWTALLGGAAGQQLVDDLALPNIILFPAGALLLGLLLIRQQRHSEVESALRESEARYCTVVSSMGEGVILQDASGVIRACNASAERILGLSAAQMMGHTPVDCRWSLVREDGSLFPPGTHPALVALQTGRQQSNVVMGIYRPHHSLSWIQVNSQPLIAAGSERPYAVITTFSDITERRMAQETLLQERNLLRTLIDSSPDYIFIKDAQGRFLVSNEAHAQAVHVSADALVGLTAFDVFPVEMAEQFHADDIAVMKSGQPLLNLEQTTLDAQGELRTVLTTKVPLRDQLGQVIGLVGISRDITDRKLFEQQALELAAERQRVTVLQRLIADMSHDFRTPLTIMNNSVYLLKKTQDVDRRQEHLQKLELQISRMGRLLDEFLAMERLEKQDQPPEMELVEINPLVYDVIRSAANTAQEKAQRLEFVLNGDIPQVMGESAQLHQVIASLVDNAMHYTPESGSIMLRTFVDSGWVVLAVQDSGGGIEAKNLPHIFDGLYRANQAQSGGTGLGLAISKKIVEAHKGSIKVVSHVGEGSTFYVRLPAATGAVHLEGRRLAANH